MEGLSLLNNELIILQFVLLVLNTGGNKTLNKSLSTPQTTLSINILFDEIVSKTSPFKDNQSVFSQSKTSLGINNLVSKNVVHSSKQQHCCQPQNKSTFKNCW